MLYFKIEICQIGQYTSVFNSFTIANMKETDRGTQTLASFTLNFKSKCSRCIFGAGQGKSNWLIMDNEVIESICM